MRHRVVTLGAVAAAVLAGAGFAVWAAWPAPVPVPSWTGDYGAPPPAATASSPPVYDLTPKPAPEIPPGTVVGTTPPKGWSHLVIKSLPRVREDQKAGLPELTVRKAGWMFTAFTADVRREANGGYALNKLGLGLGAKGTDGDVVVTSDTAKKYGVSLAPLGSGGMILDKGYEVQRKAVLPLWSPGFGLLDTPVWLRVGGENRLVRYRYALLVDRASGRLDVLSWWLAADAPGSGGSATIVHVLPNTIDPAELLVDRRKVNAIGLPSDDAFAVDGLPPGPARPFPADLRPLAEATRFTPETAADLEAKLRRLARDFPP